MPDNEREIERRVVTISPDLEGFDKRLQARIDKALKGIVGKVPVVADTSGFAGDLKTKLAKINVTYGVTLVANATGFRSSVNGELAKLRAKGYTPTYKVKLVADASGLPGSVGDGGAAKPTAADTAATKRAVKKKFQIVEGTSLKFADHLNRQINTKLNDAFYGLGDKEPLTRALQRAARERKKVVEDAAKQSAKDDSGGGGRDGGRRGGGVLPYSRDVGGAEFAEFINDRITQNLEEHLKLRRNAQEQYDSDRIKAQDDDLARERKRHRTYQEMLDHLHRQAVAHDRKRARSDQETIERDHERAQAADRERELRHSRHTAFVRTIAEELTKIDAARADDAVQLATEEERRRRAIELAGLRLRRQVIEVGERADRDATREAEREEKASLARRAAARKQLSKTPQIIDFGGRGIRPTNLLLGAVVALSPALLAVASSAAQASTAIVALGSAGIGAGLALTGLTVGFSRITEAFSLRSQAQKQAMRTSATAADTEVNNQDRILDAMDRVQDARLSIQDSLRAEREAQKAVNDERKRAIQNLKDLRQEVINLRNEESSARLSVAEAQERERRTNADFFASALDRARAHQDTLDAANRVQNLAKDRTERTRELQQSAVKGIERADNVVDAKRRLADTRRRVADTRRDHTRAARDLRRIRSTGGAAAGSPVDAAASELDRLRAKMSPAAREMDDWFASHQGMFDRLRTKIEQATLPGFTQFLREISAEGKGAKSTLELLAESAGRMGGKVGKFAAGLGRKSREPWFRASFGTIDKNTAKSFDTLGKAALKMVRPLMRLLEDSSPLLIRWSDALLRFADWFDRVIEKAHDSGALAKWFKDAGDQLDRIFRIGGNVALILGAVFKASNPSGTTLLDKLGNFTETLADKANSPEGQKAMTRFFEIFRDLPYGKIRDIMAQATTMFLAFRLIKFVSSHPLALVFTALALLAKEHPDTAIKVMGAVTDMIAGAVGWIERNPHAAVTLLGILAAAKVAKSVDIGIKLPGVDNLKKFLTGRFKWMDTLLGGTKTPVMNVRANVVNILGGVGGGDGDTEIGPDGKRRKKKKPGRPGGAPGAPGGFTSPLTGGAITPGSIAGGLVAAWLGTEAGLATVSGIKNLDQWWTGVEKRYDEIAASVEKWVTGVRTSISDFFFVTRIGWAVFLEDVQTLFGQDLPDALSPGAGGGWSGAGQRWIELFRGLGSSIPNGIAIGLFGTWAERIAGVMQFINQDVIAPMRGAFSGGGKGIVSAFVAGFHNIPSKLSGPVGRVLKWINTNVIDKINKVLGIFPGTKPIPSIGSSPGRWEDEPQRRINTSRPIKTVVRRADGGMVPGNSAHSKADNIDAKLTANEFVQPVDAVHHYGVGFMEAVRTKRFPKFAKGGLVESLTAAHGDNLITRLAGGAIRSMGGNTISSIAAKISEHLFSFLGGGTPVGDINVARIAENTARSMGASSKELLALIEAGIVESGMRNIRYGDRDSVGFLQQRPSQGWGSVSQLLNPAYATRKFINAAKRVNSKRMTAGQLAQAVQRSAYPHKYDQREADAVAILNREAPYLAGYQIAAGHWPASPAAQRGDSGIWRRIVAMVRAAGIPHQFGNAYRHGDPKWHGSGRAVDFTGYNQDRLAQFFMARRGQVLELIHRTNSRDYALTRGRPSAMRTQLPLHRNHLHVAMAAGGLVPARKFDTGGDLHPGYTLAYNGTGRTETVRTHQQEHALHQPTRLDRRDLVLLAQYIAQASTRPVHIDGRKVAEIVYSYDYLPGVR